MIVAVLKETVPGERRVALVPAVVKRLVDAGFQVVVESGAGARAGFPDAAYLNHAARLAESREALFAEAEVLLQVRSDSLADVADLERLRSGQTLIALCNPLGNPAAIQALASRGVTVFALELLPRIARAQSMDVLSSMATIAGYKAVLLAANTLPRMFPMMITAAGTVAPARVFVLGAGVAGLQAIATARRLGGVVDAYDVRPAVREQVESLGASFVELSLETADADGEGGYARDLGEDFYHQQQEALAKVVARSNVVICTASVPGRRAPVLVTANAVAQMTPGSVVIDLAAEQGGNCELTRADETVTAHDVTILGPTNLPATVPYHASEMFSRNLSAFLLHLAEDGELRFDADDEIVRETLVAGEGEIVQARVVDLLEASCQETRNGGNR